MNIETRIDARLWDAIRISYENRNFTGSIQDSMYFLTNLIRERTGLEGDGASLIGKAFGGRSPLLKVSNLQTESEKNVQQGIEQLLRGLYLAIRNPRSHEKISDREDEADAIILFINYLLNIIDKSKSPFISHVFITRIFDKDFFPDRRYAELLVDQIPKKKRMDVFYLLFQDISEGEPSNLRYFVNAFLNKLTDAEKKEIYHEISSFLQVSDDITKIRTIIGTFSGIWLYIEESARLRIENKIIKSVKDGSFHSLKQKCNSGHFGTWATNITSQFTLKGNLYLVLLDKLGSYDRGEQDYVFHFFGKYFKELLPSPSDHLIKIIVNGLQKGDERFKNMIETVFLRFGKEWYEPFRQGIEAFEERPLPFDPYYDEDEVPF